MGVATRRTSIPFPRGPSRGPEIAHLRGELCAHWVPASRPGAESTHDQGHRPFEKSAAPIAAPRLRSESARDSERPRAGLDERALPPRLGTW